MPVQQVWLTVLAALLLFGACGSSGEATEPNSNTTTTVTPCGPHEEGCTSARVIAAVAHYFEKAGATPVEAMCLASIAGAGKSAVNQAFDRSEPGEEAAAIDCVGSEARLRTIGNALLQYFRQEYLEPLEEAFRKR